MQTKALLSFLAGLLLAPCVRGIDGPTNRVQALALVNGLKYQHGEIHLAGNLARLTVPPEFKFLDRENAEKVLVNLWRNPPTQDCLGMLLPDDKTPLDEDCWAVTISYNEDGYIKDGDAAKIDYSDLLKSMQADVREASAERVKQGYPSIELVGWAAPPRYDAVAHKLYWAKELKFGAEPDHTLNYNIRILGRQGYLVLNVIAGMEQLHEVEQHTPQILNIVNFNEGSRYADFDPKIDKVATYGIAALVAGGVAAKLGLFKLIWVFILGAKKLIIVGFAGAAAAMKKFFGRNKNNSPTA